MRGEDINWRCLLFGFAIGFSGLFAVLYLGFILQDTPNCLFCNKNTNDRTETLWVAVDVQIPGHEPIHTLKPTCKDCYKAIRVSVFEEKIKGGDNDGRY